MKRYNRLFESDYRMDHTAPDKESGAPLYDITLNGIYPEDVYSPKGLYYYGTGDDRADRESYSVIQAAHNKPNIRVKIYRAVPDNNFEAKKKIKELQKLVQYRQRFPFFPVNNDTIHEIRDKYQELSYNDQDLKILEELEKQITELQSGQSEGFGINSGDWVTLSRTYAADHGESVLDGKYKIVSKMVKASEVFTNGDSLNEFGYSP